MASTTKGWHFTIGPYPSGLKFGDIPIKPAADLAPTEILVRVKAAAINPVDIQIMNLPFWNYTPGFLAPEVKGTAKDFAGVVEKAGKDTEWKQGDEIFGLYFGITIGTMQESVVMDTKGSVIVPKPASWSWPQAAALPLVYLTARTTIASIEPFVNSTKKVAILGGSSAVGMYAVHLAAARGWHVLSTCSSRNATFVHSMGASDVIDYTSPSTSTRASAPAASLSSASPSAVPDGSTVAERVAAFAPDAIIDCVGGTECVGLAPRYVTIVGDKTGRDAMGGAAIYLWHPGMVVRHLMGYLGLGKSYACVNLDLKREYLEEVLTLDPESKVVVDSVWQYGDGRKAFEKLATGRARGKVVVEIGI